MSSPNPFLTLFLLWGTATSLLASPVQLSALEGDEKRITRDEAGTLTISPGGPVKLRLTRTAPPKSGLTVLEGEIFSLGGCAKIIALPGPSFRRNDGFSLAEISHNETWVPYSTSLTREDGAAVDWEELRIDLYLRPSASLQLRNFRLREPLPEEFDEKFDETVETRQQSIARYLPANFETFVEDVAVTRDEVTVTFRVEKEIERLFLAEIPIYRAMDDFTRFEFLVPVAPEVGKPTTMTFPRVRMRSGKRYDRLTSRWQLVQVHGIHRTQVSHARYADTIEPTSPDLSDDKPRHRKGLGGWSAHRQPKGDLEALDISAVTINLPVHGLLSATSRPDFHPFDWQGTTYYSNLRALERHDATMLEAAKNNAVVSLVLLLGNPARTTDPAVKIMGHPDAHKEGVYSMPNMDSQEAVDMYGAALHLLARRYSRADGLYGRVHHYIVHNEVDAGWTWTNCGEKPLSYYLDFYHRSCRLVDLIARQQNPHARSFISLTHYWAKTSNKHFYPSRNVMEEFLRWTAAEGDFPWALAHHPYPQSLRNPRTWEDAQATMSFESDKITPHNLEVLDAWMKRPELRDRHGKTRPVHLSENGFNSPDYSEKSLTDQAAGMAYAWQKMKPLETVEVWHYHNWVDNRHEGGLRIGLRKFPDDPEPLGKKPIWHLYKALNSPQEEAAMAPYLPVVGFESWTEAHRSLE